MFSGFELIQSTASIDGITSVDIIESTSLNPTIVGNLSYCPDGSTTLDAGFGFETYVWSDGSINQTIDVITSGDFTVTVSDVTGCSGTSVVSVAESIPPNANWDLFELSLPECKSCVSRRLSQH